MANVPAAVRLPVAILAVERVKKTGALMVTAVIDGYLAHGAGIWNVLFSSWRRGIASRDVYDGI